MDLSTNVTDKSLIYASYITPNAPTNLRINIENSVGYIEWNKPIENGSNIIGYQLKNNNELIQELSSSSRATQIFLITNTTYSLTISTIYIGGSVSSNPILFKNVQTTNYDLEPDPIVENNIIIYPENPIQPRRLFYTAPDVKPNNVVVDCSCPDCEPAPTPFCKKENPDFNPLKYIYIIFHSILTLFAIYLSFKCNEGFDFLGFLMAIFFPYIYIIYKYATTDTFCDILKNE